MKQLFNVKLFPHRWRSVLVVKGVAHLQTSDQGQGHWRSERLVDRRLHQPGHDRLSLPNKFPHATSSQSHYCKPKTLIFSFWSIFLILFFRSSVNIWPTQNWPAKNFWDRFSRRSMCTLTTLAAPSAWIWNSRLTAPSELMDGTTRHGNQFNKSKKLF